MNLETYVIYILAILVLTASPGPSVLLCVTTSIAQGFAASVVTALGSLMAIVCIMTLSFTGLGVLIASSELAFNCVKWIGAAYLVYLGIKTFLAVPTEAPDNPGSRGYPVQSMFGSYFKGFVVGATNPKAIVFFTALFPQFINQEQALLPQYLLLVSTFSVLELGWLLTYAYLGARSSQWLASKARARAFNRLTGAVFVGAGVLVSTTRKAA